MITIAATVDVICDDPSHSDQPWTAARIEYRNNPPRDPDRFLWIPNRDGLAGGDPLQPLIGDEHLPPDGAVVIYDADGGEREDRATWTFGCRRCGRRVRARAEKLDPVLDTLAAHGIGSISMAALAARL